MTIVNPISKDDSANIRVPASEFSVEDVVIDNAAYSTDYNDDKVFFITPKNFSKLAIEINNTGDGSIDYDISGKIAIPDPDAAADETWKTIQSGSASLDSKGNEQIFITNPYSFLLVRFKETAAGTSSLVNFYLRAIN